MKICFKWGLISLVLVFLLLNVSFYFRQYYFIYKSFSEIKNIEPQITEFMLETVSEIEQTSSFVVENEIIIIYNSTTKSVTIEPQDNSNEGQGFLLQIQSMKIVEWMSTTPFYIDSIAPSGIYIHVPADGSKYERFSIQLVNAKLHTTPWNAVGELSISLPEEWSAFVVNRDPAISERARNVWLSK